MRPFTAIRMSALLFALLLPFAAHAEKAPPSAADFPLAVHVVSSRSRSMYNGNLPYVVYQVLETVINGQPVQLEGVSAGILALGDYPARLSPSVHAISKHPNSYDVYQGYDFLMPDGKVRTYTVVGLGPMPANP